MWPIKPLSRSLLIIFVTLALLSLTGWAMAQPASDRAVDRSGVSAPQAGVFIDQGTIMLGVNDFGQLNVPGGEPSSTNDSTIVGVRYLPTGSEGVGHGNLDEGWGVADALSGVAGWANAFHGVGNLTLHSFTTSASTAQSSASVSSIFSITQDFHPSTSPNLYQVDIVITNVTTATTNLRYRRVIDWDVEPTRWNEYITIDPGNAANLSFTSNDGFAHPNPLTGPSNRGYTGAFADVGPADYGALFDFDFGNLAPNTAKHFTLYLGAASTEIEAIVALAKVGAEAYSFAQPSTIDGPTLGTPNT